MRRSILLPLLCALTVFSAVTWTVFRQGSVRGRAEDGSDNDVESLERLERHLVEMEVQLNTKLQKLEREVAALSANKVSASQSSLAASEEASQPDGLEAPEISAAGGKAESPIAPTKLDRWLTANGMREDLQQFVAQAYEGARNQRKQREQEEAEARDAELRALQEGPYGRHNLRVNTLAKKLDLDNRQKDYLHQLMTQFDDGVSAAKTSLANPNASEEENQQIAAQLSKTRKSLGEQLERGFVRALNSDQQTQYGELPEEEHASFPGARMVISTRNGIMDFKMGLEEKTAAVVLPPPVGAPPPKEAPAK